MHLKSLTVKGFKSFASATTLQFEPGVTCVVGPNGSGKSNVVDAIAWVMGEQGAKALRGGKMEDVIFAGTSGRAPLGRAEVILTIDNTDGALPIDYTEVTISRTMFRNGGSEYAINGEPCRLLDVQELLSDSGIGREMHVIVGQGRLDTILHASADDRRGFIEEAAGVLKHRKRKEKALRKLDSMQGNLTRLNDLTSELRRQLKPLGRQAEVARRAVVIQTDVRDARLRLLADDLVNLRESAAKEEADESALIELRTGVEKQLAEVGSRETVLVGEAAVEAPQLSQAQADHLSLASLRERVAGLLSLSEERKRNLAPEPKELMVGPDPEALDVEALEAESELAQVQLAESAATIQLQAAQQARESAVAEVYRAEKAQEQVQAAAADRRESLAKLSGEVRSATARLESLDAEIDRQRAAMVLADDRLASAQTALAHVELPQELDLGALESELAAAEDAHARAESELNELQSAHSAASSERAAARARLEALRSSLSRDGGSADLLASDLADGESILGALSDLITVTPGHESQIAAALGSFAESVVLRELSDLRTATDAIRRADKGRAWMLVAGGASSRGQRPALPGGATYALDVITAPATLTDPLSALLDGVVLVDALETALEVVGSHDVVAVTSDGDVISRSTAIAGDGRRRSALETNAAIAGAEDTISRAEVELASLDARLDDAKAGRLGLRQAVETARKLLQDSKSQHAAAIAAHDKAASSLASAGAERERIHESLASAQARRVQAAEAVQAAQDALEAAELVQSAPTIEVDLEALRQSAEAARAEEVQARLDLAAVSEQAKTLNSRVKSLRASAEAERDSRTRAIARKRARAEGFARASAVAIAAAYLLNRVQHALSEASASKDSLEGARARRDVDLAELRNRQRSLAAELEQLTSSVHRDEMARAEQRVRIEQLELKALEDFGLDSEALVNEYGPQVPVPPSLQAPGDEPPLTEPQPYPFVRDEQEKRLRNAEKGLVLLGKVNPLALEEFSAMEERHAFLTTQLEDLKRGRDDLLAIVKDVDDRVQQVFAEAFEDVSREFEGVFSRLFPGGEGRLVLTDPSDLLTTGVEVEARPPGKKIKRLSLLSGGERSLTAVAFLVSLFKARPSPFYIMDEVEAALDDVNLGRLIGLMEELRGTSQLLVITHQKRTMEIADALYGVTMRQGVTEVISQKLRDGERDETTIDLREGATEPATS